jgi:hypothetical protein
MMTISRSQLGDIGTGAAFLAGFGALWALAGGASLPTRAQAALIVVVVVVIAGFSVAIARLWRHARELPASRSPEAVARSISAGRRLGCLFALEGVTIAAASWLLSTSRHDALIAPVVALIVGVHFLPLAPLFQVRAYYVTGIAMILLAMGGIAAVAVGARPGGASVFVWSSVVGIGSALILWVTALWALLRGYALWRQAEARR